MVAIINKLPEDINYMFYIKPKGAKRFSTYNPGKGTMGTGLVFTELYHKEHLLAVCKWIAEDNSGVWIYQLRSAGGKKIYWEYDSMLATPIEAPQIPTEAVEMVNVSAEGEKEAERAEIAITSITRLNVLKYKLQHPKLKEWAVKYGLLDLVRNMYCAPELSLGGLWIDNKFRQSLCENDKMIINAVRKLIADAEKAA